ncbi:hypothetical protein WN943_010369 [Citrus x changshan-huyou]
MFFLVFACTRSFCFYHNSCGRRVKNFEFFFYHSQFNFFMTLDNNLIKPLVKMAYHSAMGDIATSEAHIRPAAQEPTSQLIPRILKLVGRTNLTRQQRIPKRI